MLWYSRKRGFTLIELLVVILILAILMAIALPLYLRAVADSEKKTCRTNMQTIANAEQAYKVRSMAHEYVEITGTPGAGGAPATYTFTGVISGAVTDFEGVTADLTAMPICPKSSLYVYTVAVGGVSAPASYQNLAGGTSDVPDGGLLISCSYELGITGTEHGFFCPGVDAQ